MEVDKDFVGGILEKGGIMPPLHVLISDDEYTNLSAALIAFSRKASYFMIEMYESTH